MTKYFSKSFPSLKLLVDIFLKNHCFQHNYIFILSLSSKEPIAYVDSKQHNGIKKNPRVNGISPMKFHNANCWWLFVYFKIFYASFWSNYTKRNRKGNWSQFFFKIKFRNHLLYCIGSFILSAITMCSCLLQVKTDSLILCHSSKISDALCSSYTFRMDIINYLIYC